MALMLSFGSQAMASNVKTPSSGSIDLTNAPLTNSLVTPFSSVNVGGGTWDYGTSLSGLTQKKVYSNYLHPTSKHHASCSIGANMSSSGVVAAKTTAFSSAIGGLDDATHAYWGTD
jgi:hypothetical protein